MASVLGYLPFLALLACPLLMAFCFFGMRKMGCSTDANPADATAGLRGMTAPEQVAALQAQLSRLQAEQAVIAMQLADIATEEPREAQPASPALHGPVTISPVRA